MAEDMDLGRDKLQEDIEERRREAAGERDERRDRDGRPHWLDYLAISTALFAQQTCAVDTWSEFQADSIKKQTQLNLAILLAHVGGTPAEIKAANDEAARRQGQQDDLMKEAKARHAEAAALNEEAQGQLGHHHRFAVAVTYFV